MIDDTFASVSNKLSLAKLPSVGPHPANDPEENSVFVGLFGWVKMEIKSCSSRRVKAYCRLLNRLLEARSDVGGGSISQLFPF
jgi:hypothetical protein